jgi:hypothetical protein
MRKEETMPTKRRIASVLVAAAITLTIFACDLPFPTPTVENEPLATDTPEPAPGSISGVLWHEICQFTGGQAGEPVVLGLGCVQWGAESWQFGPNQIMDPFEVGWEGVTLHLGAGACPASGLTTAMTNIDGEYSFGGLAAGTYCVSYNSLADGNDVILIPGGPTYPIRGEAGNLWTIELAEGVDETGWNFGYAWQFYN